MRRLFALLTTASLIGATGWLTTSESGLRLVIAQAEQASGGQLQVEQAEGRLLGPLRLGQLRWQSPSLQIEATDLQLDWRPSALLHGTLHLRELSAERLHISTPPSSEPTPIPSDLQLPAAVDVEKIAISALSFNAAISARAVQGRFRSDGRQHQLSAFSLETADIALSGEAQLDGQAPFPLSAQAQVSGQLEQRPLALSLDARGPLERIAVEARATQGVSGQASALLTPFAASPLASARLQIDALDPASWLAGAPQAKLNLVAELQPHGKGLAGSFGLSNQQPGPLDRQRLPLRTLAGSFRSDGEQATFDRLHASLPGQGELSGSGEWQGSSLRLDLNARQLDAAQLLSLLRSTRLNGPISTRLGRAEQTVQIDLADARFRLRGEARHAAGRLQLPQLLLSADAARLSAQGEVDLNAGRAFKLQGELQHFDPRRFLVSTGQFPSAQLNARWQASGQLSGEPRIAADLTLHDSQLAGQPLSGHAHFNLAWPLLPQLDLALQAGANQLTAQGAFGRPDDRLQIQLSAPQLAPYGLQGGIQARLTLAGLPSQPSLQGEVQAEQLGRPGLGQISGLQLQATLGGSETAAQSIELRLARLDLAEQPGLLRALHLHGTGSQLAHQLQAEARLAGEHQLKLSASGGLQGGRWQGQLASLQLTGPEPARNLQLVTPAPLQLASSDWAFGPAQLAGKPLDWQATLQAAADARQLTARLHGRGSRIGQIDGQLQAGMRGAWQLASDAPWRAKLSSDIADLGWLGELIGDGWQSAGRLRGELQVAGTPAQPLSSGRFVGEQLALRLPAQGLNLARGELDIDLRDNLLQINRLRFASLLQAPPRALRLAARDDLAQLTTAPGHLEIKGEMRVDRSTAGERAFLDVHLERLGVFQLPDQWLTLSGDGRLTWQDGTLGARGQVAVDAGYWQLAPSGAPRLSDDVVIKRPGGPPSAKLRPRLDLDLGADLGRNFLFNGAGLSSRLVGELRLTAQGRDLPRASGSIRARDGRFDAYGQKLAIERGILNFNGLLDNPGLDVRALRKGLAVEAGVQISGSAQKPLVKLVSDPDLPEAEKLAWLVLGHGPEQMGAGDATLLFSAAGGLLGNDSANVVQQLKKTFGFDELGIRQGNLGDSLGRQPSSRVAGSTVDPSSTGQQIFSVGKRLSSNALLSYEQTLGKAESVVKLSVSLGRQLTVVGRAGSDNALDIFYSLAFGRADKAPEK